MSFETENKYEADTDEEYYEDRETFRNVSGPPNATLIAEIFLERAGNGSKGNGTRVSDIINFYVIIIFSKTFYANMIIASFLKRTDISILESIHECRWNFLRGHFQIISLPMLF